MLGGTGSWSEALWCSCLPQPSAQPEQSVGSRSLQPPPAWRLVAATVQIFTFLTAFYLWLPSMVASNVPDVTEPLRVERGGGEHGEREERQKIFPFFKIGA